MTKPIHALFVCSLFATCCFAQTPPVKVLPWNGHKAAASLTFDDALPVHLDIAAPALKERHLSGTFFLIVSRTTRIEDWKRVLLDGNEIGNHSVSHEDPNSLTAEQAERQISDAKDFFTANLGSTPETYAYPYAQLTAQARDKALEHSFLARGWHAVPNTPYLTLGCGLDWFNVPSLATNTETSPAEVRGWVDTDLSRSAWVVLQIHGIGKDTGFDPVSPDTFLALLDEVQEAREKSDLWVAPFGVVGAYWRATDIFEQSKFESEIRGGTYHWNIPSNFPGGVVLKVKTLTSLRLYQDGKQLKADKAGFFPLSFDSKSLTVVSQ
jgi:peptidoglycan/xylan/chitin deacetylase (PgdA/CDA1 family)